MGSHRWALCWLLLSVPALTLPAGPPPHPVQVPAPPPSTHPASPELLDRLTSAGGVRLYQVGYHEPACEGGPDSLWEGKVVECVSIRRTLPPPSQAWRASLVRLLGDPRCYSTDYEKLCICWPDLVAQFETREGPLYVWFDMGATRVRITSPDKGRRAWGGFDDVAGEYRRLVDEALTGAVGSNRPGPFLAANEFVMERDSLPYLEAPELLWSREEGVRLVPGRASPGPGESKVRVRLTPGSRGASARLSGRETANERERIKALLEELATKPAMRNGKPMSSWVDLVYPATSFR